LRPVGAVLNSDIFRVDRVDIELNLDIALCIYTIQDSQASTYLSWSISTQSILLRSFRSSREFDGAAYSLLFLPPINLSAFAERGSTEHTKGFGRLSLM
jgi:hypothetical protein